ncbi:hypothetical protein [Jannaschia sp. LMIT008]|uniref:hypothetical protein n=1 Tax=Jannaschia maritima TaxID=3032585 RepID=UPI002810D6BC|nr:hypothetical protein [Jannaschia sp. LMIT008]
MGHITVINDYPVGVDALWDNCIDMSAMARTMKGLLRYDGLRHGKAHQGLVLNYDVSLFGLLPARPSRVEFVELDRATLRFRTVETSEGLRAWNHTMQITETPGGSRLSDTVEIEAEVAWQTPLFERFARHVYRRRHAPRLAMLTGGAGPGRGSRRAAKPRDIIRTAGSGGSGWQRGTIPIG